ncbi:hypothetical protein RS130_04260 [Paraglaciecola aquimarina]|uniref:Uncharacterized protein n=1 Tax=Paraglaciecola aquimarina TaxID=1235557 RepID=A0ABU3STA7_9ALTE|nr:hypothetical protein [Paraglaciecola aquimarina]MDU0353246.1 hypothetical protein [Paraglaciecola aquimarina]
MNINSNVNSAIISGTLGLKTATNNIAQHADNLASLAVRTPTNSDPQSVLVNASVTQLAATKQLLPQSSSSITSDLVGLSVNGANAQASAKVLGVAGDTVGTILDILA